METEGSILVRVQNIDETEASKHTTTLSELELVRDVSLRDSCIVVESSLDGIARRSPQQNTRGTSPITS